MIYLCFSMSTDGDKSNTTGDLFVVELDVDYPLTCGTVKICNNHFIDTVYRTIELSPPDVSFRLSFTSGITSNVQLVFESISETINTNTSSISTTSKNLLFIFITGAVCLIWTRCVRLYFREEYTFTNVLLLTKKTKNIHEFKFGFMIVAPTSINIPST